MYFDDFYHPYGSPVIPTQLPRPERDDEWMKLCQDPKWRFQGCHQQDLYFCQSWRGMEHQDEFIDKIIPAPREMHPGALAPKFVFESDAPMDEPGAEDMSLYKRRLICAITGRFVCISRPSASHSEKLEASQGQPISGVRYWWRYWDNDGNVYQVRMEKWRVEVLDGRVPTRDPVQEAGEHGRLLLPGDFSSRGNNPVLWMQVPAQYCAGGRPRTNLSKFWENLWLWKHCGSTGLELWDKSLIRLAAVAGVPFYREIKICATCGVTEGDSGDQKTLKRCGQCKMTYYCSIEHQKKHWKDHKKHCQDGL